MKTHLMAAASAYLKRSSKLILDYPMDANVNDKTGNTSITRIGFTGNDAIVEVSGAKAFRQRNGQGLVIHATESSGKFHPANQDWVLEWDVNYIGVSAYSHDTILATYVGTHGTEPYGVSIWNHQHSGDRLIVNTGNQYRNEGAPALIDKTGSTNNVWYSYRLVYTKSDTTLKLYRNDTLQSSRVITPIPECSTLWLRSSSGNDNNNGYVRNVKHYTF